MFIIGKSGKLLLLILFILYLYKRYTFETLLLSLACLQLTSPLITYMFYQYFYFIIIPITALFFSIAVMLTPNPIFSLFFLISLFFTVVFLLFSLQIEFLAMIYLIIYIGAISILFLFVIMMFNLKQLQKKKSTFFLWSTIFIYIWVFPKFYNILINNLSLNSIMYNSAQPFWNNNPHNFFLYQKMDILIFSEFFYNYYAYLFLLSGMILLTAMLGSIILALSTVESSANTEKFKNIFLK